MSFYSATVSCLRRFLPPLSGIASPALPSNVHLLQQVRHRWADHRMMKNVKRRKCVVEFADLRLRLSTIRKNTILPAEVREIADKEIVTIVPLNSIKMRSNKRCAFTSRSRGLVHDWRLSRIAWRHLADYNKLSGVQRALWG